MWAYIVDLVTKPALFCRRSVIYPTKSTQGTSQYGYRAVAGLRDPRVRCGLDLCFSAANNIKTKTITVLKKIWSFRFQLVTLFCVNRLSGLDEDM